jgi:hypothetical protein
MNDSTPLPPRSWWLIFKELHSHVQIYFAYLVGLSTVLQISWGEMEVYFPAASRHSIVASMAIISFLDNVRRTLIQVNHDQSRDKA